MYLQLHQSLVDNNCICVCNYYITADLQNSILLLFSQFEVEKK